MMQRIAVNLENYLNLFTDIMVFPKGFNKKDEKEIFESVKLVKKLIKKLKKGDQSVFRGDTDIMSSSIFD